MLSAALVLVCSAAVPAVQEEADAGYRAMPWRVVGPFPANAAPATTQRLPPEATLRHSQPGEPWDELAQEYESRRDEVLAWMPLTRTQNDARVLDLNEVLEAEKPLRNASMMLYRSIHVDEATPLSLTCGTTGGLKIWFNGRMVLRHDGAGPLRAGANSVLLHASEGINHLVVKCVTKSGPWQFTSTMSVGEGVGRAAVNAAIDRGVQFLLARQLPDGSWPDYRQAHPGAIAGIACFTLMKCGLPPEHPAVARGLDFMRDHPSQGTYGVGLMLMAYAQAAQEIDEDRIASMANDLIKWQNQNGLWGYPSGDGDLSCTQFAILGLRAASAAGISVPEATWRSAVRGIRACSSGGGFGYSPGGRGASISMTAAGVGSLGICLEQLREGTAAKRASTGIDDGLAWLGRNCRFHAGVASIPNPYSIYGIERAGAMADTETFGEHAWYPEGAALLLEAQHTNGGWTSGMADLDSCFILLFLRRATSTPLVGPVSGVAKADADDTFLASSKGAGPLFLRVSLRAPQRMWIASDAPVLGDLQRVVYFVMPPGETWTRVEGTDGDLYAAMQDFRTPGDWQVRANGFTEDGTSYSSGIIEFTVAGGEAGTMQSPTLADRLLDDALDLRKELTQLARRDRLVGDVTVSSQSSRHAAVNSIDHRLDMGWRCAPGDLRPTWTLRFRASKKIRLLKFVHPPMDADDVLPRPLAAMIRVSTGDGPDQVFTLSSDPSGVSVLRLQETVRTKDLKIQVLDVHHGQLGSASVGIGELLID